VTKEKFARIYCKTPVDVKIISSSESSQKKEIVKVRGKGVRSKSAQSLRDAKTQSASWQLLRLSLSRHTDPRVPRVCTRDNLGLSSPGRAGSTYIAGSRQKRCVGPGYLEATNVFQAHSQCGTCSAFKARSAFPRRSKLLRTKAQPSLHSKMRTPYGAALRYPGLWSFEVRRLGRSGELSQR